MVSQVMPLSASATRPPVLIVEDERTSRRAMAALLSRCGFQPAPFESAEEALQAVLDGTHPRVCPDRPRFARHEWFRPH